MFKKMKKVLPIALVGLFSVASVAWGSTAGVTGGSLLVSSNTDSTAFNTGNPIVEVNSGINFNSLGTIDISRNLSSALAYDHVFVADNTGKNAGWNVKVTASPFTASVTDSTATGNITIAIPAQSVLTAVASNPRAWFGSKSQAQVNSTTFPVGATGVTLFYADKGAGAGAYVADVKYTLSLPNYLPEGSTVTPSSDSSAFKGANVTQLGLFAGTYSTTITYSLTVAP